MDALAYYRTRGYKHIKGWLSEGAVKIIFALDRIQRKNNIRGDIAEIGVHHGRLFILLALLRQKGERAFAMDLFDQQHMNVGSSGKGDKEIFLKHLRAYALADITVKTANSLHVKSMRGRFRLFSIDGGHAKEIVHHDLSLASGALADGGIIILDDYFNEDWPGVSEGANAFFSVKRDIAPFAIGGNKVFLATRSHAKGYLHELEQLQLGSTRKKAELFNSCVVCLGFRNLGWREHIGKSPAWRKMHATPLGKMIKKISDRY